MFGYVRPYTPELKVRELELYRAAYCGLCAALGRRFGFAARCVLGYDFVFLTMLFVRPDAAVKTTQCRCPLSWRRKRCLDCGAATETAAAYCVILAYHKLRDDIADEGFLRGTAARFVCLLLGGAYRKAAAEFPEFDSAARECAERLTNIETDGNAPLDAAADAFAKLLALTAADESPPERRRVAETLLYHVGRWIYIIDARDDMIKDGKLNRPNAVTARMGDMTREARDERLRVTLDNSLSVAGSALELYDENAYIGILRNIIYLGLPSVQDSVFRGEFDAKPRGNAMPQ